MTCASVELVEAISGVSPRRDVGLWSLSEGFARIACESPKALLTGSGAQAATLQLEEDTRVVDCKPCLALMASARGKERTEELAVHADSLEEKRGAA